MRWNPSVRTRHLIICLALVLLTAASLASFDLSRLVREQLGAKRRDIENLTDICNLQIFLSLTECTSASLPSFALSRLVIQQQVPKRRAIETLTDQLTQFAQAAILNRTSPNEAPPVVTLLQATTGETKQFAYCL